MDHTVMVTLNWLYYVITVHLKYSVIELVLFNRITSESESIHKTERDENDDDDDEERYKNPPMREH